MLEIEIRRTETGLPELTRSTPSVISRAIATRRPRWALFALADTFSGE
jgi:hypothetical protein